MIETAQKCCDKVNTKQEKKQKKMNDSVTALKNKHLIYPSTAHECISYQLLLPNKKVWSLSFTTEIFSSQDMSPITNSLTK